MAGRPARRARRPGQHFLRSRALVCSLVDGAGIRAGDVVVDVGAGHGAITSELVRRGAAVWAVEVDPLLAAELRHRFRERVRVVEADAARLRWPSEPFAVVANLPFGGAAAIQASRVGHPTVPRPRAEGGLQGGAAPKPAAPWTTHAGFRCLRGKVKR